MATPVTPVDNQVRKDGVKTFVGPGKSAAVFQQSKFAGMPPVPYQPWVSQIQYVTATANIEFAPLTVVVDASGGAVTLTLPIAGAFFGKQITIVKFDVGANTVTLTAQTPDTFWTNSGFVSLSKQYESVTLVAMPDSSGNPGWLNMMNKVVV